MPRKAKNPEEVVVEETPVVENKVVEEEVVEKSAGDVSVLNETGSLVRVYTKKDHGKDFRKLAESFISDRKGYSLK